MSAPEARDVNNHGPLRPVELATAAVLGAMTVVLVVAGSFLPHATALTALGAVPLGVVAFRHRPRAVLAAAVASASVGFIISGTSVIPTIAACAVIGGLGGHARKKRWSIWALLGATAVIGPILGAGADALFWVFGSLRALAFQQLLATSRGLAGVIGRVLDLVGRWIPGGAHLGRDVAHAINHIAAFAVRNWWELIPLGVVAAMVVATVIIWLALQPVVERLERVTATDRLAVAGSHSDEGTAVAPVPVGLVDVRVRYPGATVDALRRISTDIDERQLVAILGPNGSGKSTLARVLAGRPPTSGQVIRAGAAGLGLPDGTAVIAQRPESQVLGVRVIDDLVWGLARDAEVDVAALLDEVGLHGMERRETSGLSGGQLQRLAIAAALARRPRLLISDESTAMVDPDGRSSLVDLLGRLPPERAMTVVHVTHRLAETAGADLTVRLDGRPCARAGGGVDDRGMESVTSHPHRPPVVPASAAAAPQLARSGPILRLRDVGHIYAEGTPWARNALRRVSLDIERGDGVLVVGGNGSGKTTLAWAIAGLLLPSSGSCTLDGRPVHRQVGAVALAFQHARLQVQRSTVGRDVRAAGGVDRKRAEAALGLVGLDPDELWSRSVDELSGGQLRRVALAGLLARTPRVLVLDEPLAGLDDASRSGLSEVLGDLRSRGLTLVVISHELDGVGEVCDRVIRLEGGAVVADGPMNELTEARLASIGRSGQP